MMKQYIGTKLIQARPMNRADYNAYRGWELPVDEDGADEGYLVEYTDGGKANHPDHVGYISWSPKEQFKKAYKTGVKDNKVMFEHIEAMVGSLTYKFERVGDTTVTGCWAFLPSGFQVAYGESACVDPANYDQALGEKYAKERCVAAASDQLWKLERYVLSKALS